MSIGDIGYGIGFSIGRAIMYWWITLPVLAVIIGLIIFVRRKRSGKK